MHHLERRNIYHLGSSHPPIEAPPALLDPSKHVGHNLDLERKTIT